MEFLQASEAQIPKSFLKKTKKFRTSTLSQILISGFDVLLTVQHLGMILVMNQLNAQNLVL